MARAEDAKVMARHRVKMGVSDPLHAYELERSIIGCDLTPVPPQIRNEAALWVTVLEASCPTTSRGDVNLHTETQKVARVISSSKKV